MNHENSHKHGDCCHTEKPMGQHKHHPPKISQDVKVTADTIFTCPMHPEVRQKGPGHCPICGMSLEPLVNTGEVDTTELKDMTKRFWFATAFSLFWHQKYSISVSIRPCRSSLSLVGVAILCKSCGICEKSKSQHVYLDWSWSECLFRL